jgi:hypothetical protein
MIPTQRGNGKSPPRRWAHHRCDIGGVLASRCLIGPLRVLGSSCHGEVPFEYEAQGFLHLRPKKRRDLSPSPGVDVVLGEA